jgi:hypothetical protein
VKAQEGEFLTSFVEQTQEKPRTGEALEQEDSSGGRESTT